MRTLEQSETYVFRVGYSQKLTPRNGKGPNGSGGDDLTVLATSRDEAWAKVKSDAQDRAARYPQFKTRIKKEYVELAYDQPVDLT